MKSFSLADLVLGPDTALYLQLLMTAEKILNKDKSGKIMYFEVKSVSTKVGPGQILTRRKSKKDRTRTNVGTG